MFLSDEIPPNAVLIEHIPGVREIDLSSFSKERITKLRRILDSMHRAKVEHGDPFPRNMMIQAGKYERGIRNFIRICGRKATPTVRLAWSPSLR